MKTMSECRVCLAIRKNSRSLFEPTDRNINTTYADMITYVASVKIVRDDGITDQICIQCCKKLRDLYHFKLLIQSSNTSLHQKINTHLKTIHFNNITEVKFEIEMAQTDDKYLLKEYEDVKINLLNTKTFCYKDTTIKKLESNIVNAEIDKEPMSVIDFLKTIEEDPDDNYDPDFDMGAHDSDEYLPPNSNKKKNRQKYSKNKKSKSSKIEIKAKENKDRLSIKRGIKPIILNDLRVMKTLVPKKIGPKTKATYSKQKKTESICPYCGKITRTLHTHILVHSEPEYKCDKCEKKYHTRRDLSHHMETHSNIKPFKCDQCIAAFYNIRALKSHKYSHLDIRKFVCDICNKSYKRPQQLSRHARTHNSANKSHKCEQCNMSFFSAYGLRHHTRVHTGERPYNCELCSQPYSYKHDFNRHCLKKHGIFLKRRSVAVMDAQVLARERRVMAELQRRARGPAPAAGGLPFADPQAAQAFEQAIRAFRANPRALDSH